MKETKQGWNAMGLPVPSNRLQRGYRTVQEILNCGKEEAWSIAQRVANFIERDEIAYVIGTVTYSQAVSLNLGGEENSKHKFVDEKIGTIDLTGRYRLLAVMLTD